MNKAWILWICFGLFMLVLVFSPPGKNVCLMRDAYDVCIEYVNRALLEEARGLR